MDTKSKELIALNAEDRHPFLFAPSHRLEMRERRREGGGDGRGEIGGLS